MQNSAQSCLNVGCKNWRNIVCYMDRKGFILLRFIPGYADPESRFGKGICYGFCLEAAEKIIGGFFDERTAVS